MVLLYAANERRRGNIVSYSQIQPHDGATRHPIDDAASRVPIFLPRTRVSTVEID